MLHKTRTILVMLILLFASLQAQQTIFYDGFENGEFDLSHWEPVPGPNNGIIQVIEDSSTPEEFFSVRLGKNSDGGGKNKNELRLYLDLSDHKQVALEFWIRDWYDETGPFDAIYFSDDSAASFKKVFVLDVGAWNDSWGKLPPLDVDGLAKDNGLELNNKFVISFQQYGTGDFSSAYGDKDGYLIDAVRVYDPQITYATLPYINGFESGNLDNTLTWAFPSYPGSGTTTMDRIKPGGRVVILEDATAPEETKSLYLGRRNDGGHTTNAVDIHLDLSQYEQVQFDYWIREYLDNDNDEDGIFFSDNGGLNFVKVFDFLPESWNDNFWGKFPPLDVDRLALENGISLSDSFVIRVQQRGTGDFSSSYGDKDGLIFDHFQVMEVKTDYVDSFPFEDGFESGKLDSMWSWGNAFFPAQTARSGSLRPGGYVVVSDGVPNTDFYYTFLGRRNDGASTTNALDLHVNLEGQENVELEFWIADHVDESGPSDGVWFSNDAGESFAQIYQFDPSNWSDNIYRQITIDIADSAQAKNLELTERCIFRFQQNGSGDYSTSYGAKDGLRIDDVAIRVAPSIPSLTSPENGAAAVAVDTVLNWNIDANAERYHLQFSESADFAVTLIDSNSITTNSLAVSGLSSETSYYWRVRAINTIGVSAWSEVWNFTTVKTAPGVTQLLSPAEDATNVVIEPELSWMETADAASYNLQVATEESFANPIIDQTDITTTSHQISDLQRSTLYYWRVAAVNSGGAGLWSAIWQFTTIENAPAAPALTFPADNAEGVATESAFHWFTTSDADEYRFQLASDLNFTNLLKNETGLTDTTILVQDLEFSKVYFWRVSASNSGGTGPWSSAWQFKTMASSAVEAWESSVPTEFALLQNYPNPFNPSTTILYALPEKSDVHLAIFNTAGQLVKTVVNGTQASGSYSISVDMQNVSSGLYFYRLKAGPFRETRRMLLFK